MKGKKLDFDRINRAALARLPELLQAWLKDGHREGNEFVARNPNRSDRRLGSFKINLRSGKWGDFSTGDGGGDVISLAAFLSGESQVDAARKLAAKLGIADE